MILSNDTFSRYMVTLYQTPVDLMEFIPDTEIEIFTVSYNIPYLFLTSRKAILTFNNQ